MIGLFIALIEYITAFITLLFWLFYAGFVYCPLMVLFGLFTPLIGPKKVQQINNYIVHIYWVQLTCFVEKYVGIEYHFYGDQVKDQESAIVIANHQSFIDWLMIFPFAMRKASLGNCNFFAKDVIKYIPGMGWVRS